MSAITQQLQNITGVQQLITALTPMLESQQEQIATLESINEVAQQNIAQLQTENKQLRETVHTLEGRVQLLENIETRLARTEQKVDTMQQAMFDGFTTTQQEFIQINRRFDQVENSIGHLNAHITGHTQTLNEIRELMRNLPGARP